MLIPNKYNGYVNGRRLYNIDAGIGEAALLSAMIGGGSAAISGGDPLKGALLGALTGGIGGAAAPALGSMFGAAAPALTDVATAGASIAPEAGTSLANLASLGAQPAQAATDLGFNFADASSAANNAARQAYQQSLTSLEPSINTWGGESTRALATLPKPDMALNANQYFGMPSPTITNGITNLRDIATNPSAAMQSAAIPNTLPSINAPSSLVPRTSLFDDPMKYIGEHKFPAIAAGVVGLTGARKNLMPTQEKYTGPLSRFHFNPDTYIPGRYAEGGITTLASGGYDEQVGEEPMDMPAMASGGIATLGGYSDGGRMLKGPGDGMSDSIPASIAGRQPARLARDEFVVPADVVSHLGNGSSDAGAKQLYDMMDRIRQARTGSKKQGREIKPTKFMPA